MTIEELAKLKKGEKLMWNGEIVTFDAIRVCVGGIGSGIHFVPLEDLQRISGPTLPTHVAEIWEWDGSPKGSKISVGWVWHENWEWPHFGTNYLNVWRLIRKRCACQKEDK